MSEKKRAYAGIVRNSLFETSSRNTTQGYRRIFSATSSRARAIPIEEEKKVTATRDVYVYL